MPDHASAPRLPGVRALFQQRLSGDDALLRLAERRFREAAMPAEVYAENPDQLEHLLRFVPEHDTLPVVHLNRSADLLRQSGRDLVESFASRFPGRVAGLVVHDKAAMAERLPRCSPRCAHSERLHLARPAGPWSTWSMPLGCRSTSSPHWANSWQTWIVPRSASTSGTWPCSTPGA